MITRALLFAAGPEESADPGEQTESVWIPLLPLVDRPFLQQVVEQLAALGIRELDVVLSRQPERIETLLGDGSRWGLTIRTHLAAEPCTVFHRLPPSDEAVLIAFADRLPLGVGMPTAYPALWQTATGDATGWAVASFSALTAIPAAATDETALWDALRVGGAANIIADHVLSARTYADLLAAQKRALSGDCPELLRTGSEIEPGITLSRNVVLHPAARLLPPVFIGEDCRIEAGAQIGPNAVVGSHCVVDVGATLVDSLLLRGSYVGEGLEVRDAIVDRNRLTSVRHGASVVVSDSFLLGDLSEASGREAIRAGLSQAAALFLLFLFWPLVLWAKSVRPISPPDGWRHLFDVFLPGLPAAAAGRVRLVGVPARNEAEINALPTDWRALYRRAPVGLITEAFVIYGPHATPDERYSAEAYFAVAGGIRHDLSLFARYLVRLFMYRRGPEAANAETDAEDFPNREMKNSEIGGSRGKIPAGEVRNT